MEIYQPAEDSYLLQKFVSRYAYGRVLDVGTGSGIQAITALGNPQVREVVAIDIDAEAVSVFEQKVQKQKLRKIKVLKSDLFEEVSGYFNVIIFNPPYLPQDQGIKDRAIYGGKKGWEISERFFKEVSNHLFPEGEILFLFSSLTNKQKIEEMLSHNLLGWEELGEEKIAFETLYAYKITKTSLLRRLEGKLLRDVHYFAEGTRGVIYTAKFDRSKLVKSHFPAKRETFTVAVKVKKKESKAEDAIASETLWLKALNKRGIGPKFLFSEEEYVVYEFVEGYYIEDWLPEASKEAVKKVLIDVLEQCFILDLMNVNKEEMHNPLKHIIVDAENTSVLIDFERCYETEKPHNVTQFVDFIGKQGKSLLKKGFSFTLEKLREAAAEYKQTYGEKEFENIIKLLN